VELYLSGFKLDYNLRALDIT